MEMSPFHIAITTPTNLALPARRQVVSILRIQIVPGRAGAPPNTGHLPLHDGNKRGGHILDLQALEARLLNDAPVGIQILQIISRIL